MGPKIARLTRLVRSLSGRSVVQTKIIEPEDDKPDYPVEKVKESTPEDGDGKPAEPAPEEEAPKEEAPAEEAPKEEAPPEEPPKEEEAPKEEPPKETKSKGKGKKGKGKKKGSDESGSGDDTEDLPVGPQPFLPLRFVSIQYPYGFYVGQTTPDRRLMCEIPHGRGRFFYNDGAIYDGEWNRGNWEGEAVRMWPLGARYHGQFKNNMQHGKGVLVLPNGGGGYIGAWKNGFQHGKGILTTPDGQTCEGDFVRGNPHGKCILRTPQGMVYEGDFTNGLPHGKGTAVYPDGTKYEGDFKDGAMHGQFLRRLTSHPLFPPLRQTTERTGNRIVDLGVYGWGAIV